MTELNTLDEAAGKLKCSVKTVRRQIDSGKLEAVRVGRSIRITNDALEKFIDASRI